MGIDAPVAGVRRHFVTIDGTRQIHYRRAGKGPPVLLLHQSPKSSREHLPLMQHLMDRFTCISPDTPGNGNSDPLSLSDPDMADYGDNVAAFLDALGIDKIAVYGFHTGASVGAAFAARHPNRVHIAVLNGLVTLNAEERADILANYLTPFEPHWDGSHLTWLWARLREQTIFFPWYRPSLAGRMHGPVPAPEVLHDGVLEFLRSGDHYRGPYGAAFKLDGAAMVAAMKSPAIICASDWDPTSNYLDRLPATMPDGIRVERLGDRRGEAVYSWVAEVLADHAKGIAPASVAPTAMADGTWQDFADVEGGQLHVRRTEGPGRPLLVQHDAASDNRIVHRVTQSLAGKRPAFAFDLPGNGESDNTIGEDVTVARHADVLTQALDALGLGTVDYYGMWGGGLPGLDLAVRTPDRINRLVMSNVLYFSAEDAADYYENYTFPIEIDWFGGHLVKCWIAMRDQGLFWPWYRRTREGVIRQEPFVDTEMVHNRVVSMLKAGNMWRHAYRAHFSYPTGEMLGKNARPTLLGSPIWDPNHPHGEAAHADHPNTQWRELPPDMADWAPAFLPFLDE